MRPSLTPAEAAARLGVNPKTLTRWHRRGLLDGRVRVFTTLGGHRRFDTDDIDRLAERLTEVRS